ncbi:MAG: hypothetical protein QG588_1452, partial [Candidatus Poribacteria bacterium]|nr:hypothetical protein [Candidatus Poribacteria bacterium]
MMKITVIKILLFTSAKIAVEDLHLLGILLSLIFFGLFINYIIFMILARLQKKTKSLVFLDIINYLHNPGKLFFPAFFVILAMPYLKLPFNMANVIKQLFNLIFVICLTWLAVRSINILQDYIYRKYTITDIENLKARQIQTSFKIAKKVLRVIIFIIAFSTILMSFETVRRVGFGILASAGVIGIIISFAAQ